MHAIRALLLVVLIVIVGFVAYVWWNGSGMPHAVATPSHQTTGTSGAIDVSRARERGAELGEHAAKTAEAVRETVDEAAITSKIKAKMALDDSVRARSIDVSTSGSTVTLSGTVRSTAEHDRAVRLARETNGVTSVIDRLDVRP
ncbi:MAG TPA: BON domain-containing protein [Vicinamibacterales bacterium]|nr:BON domain-containing protein [Vicinamibacterales bacterium]